MKKLALLLVAGTMLLCACSANEGNQGFVDVEVGEKPTPTAPVQTAEPSPSPTPAPKVYEKEIADALAKNTDVVGWIRVEGTNIDYPIMNSRMYELSNGATTYYYNDHNFEGEKAASGAVYTYYNAFQKNNCVTAHNSRVSGTMFHELHHVYDYNMGETVCTYRKCDDALTDTLPDLKNQQERIWTVSVHGEERQWELFSIYQTKPGCDIYETLYDNIWWPGKDKKDYTKTTDEQIQAWIDKQLKNSEIDLGVSVTTEDTFLTMLTCGTEKADADKNARLYLFFKAVS